LPLPGCLTVLGKRGVRVTVQRLLFPLRPQTRYNVI
jgi:hypothetical protein